MNPVTRNTPPTRGYRVLAFSQGKMYGSLTSSGSHPWRPPRTDIGGNAPSRYPRPRYPR
jgi:hypothetical protein